MIFKNKRSEKEGKSLSEWFYKTILILVSVSLLSFSYQTFINNEVPNKKTLNQQIIQGINCPYEEADTIVLINDGPYILCGNTPEHLKPVFYNFGLYNPSTIQQLSKQLAKTVLTSEDYWKLQGRIVDFSYNDSLPKHIASLEMAAEVINKYRIELREIYRYHNKASYYKREYKYTLWNWKVKQTFINEHL